jgi:hypothetical protein
MKRREKRNRDKLAKRNWSQKFYYDSNESGHLKFANFIKKWFSEHEKKFGNVREWEIMQTLK